MKEVSIPISHIVPCPFINPDTIQHLIESMKTEGQRTPIEVCRYKSSEFPQYHYAIFDGYNRYNAAKALRWTSIKAYVRET